MLKLILIGLSFLFGIISIRHLRQFDVHEKEPFLKMLAVTIWGGVVSVFLSLFFYRVLQDSGININEGKPFTYFYVGLVEELGKLMALALCWPLIRKEMDEPTDGPIYIACVALGFSLIENYFYATANPYTTPLIAIRLLICTPMHIAFSMFMGLAFFWAVHFKGGWGLLIGAYFVASIYHGLYDIIVSYWFLLPGLYFIIKSAYNWMHQLLGYTATHSPFRQSLSEFLQTHKHYEIEPGFECLDCGNGAPKPTYRRGRIRIQRCEACSTFLCSPTTLFQIIHQYGSLFGDLKKQLKPLSRAQKKICVCLEANRIDRKKRTACFRLDELNAALEKRAKESAEKLERKWWFPIKCER